MVQWPCTWIPSDWPFGAGRLADELCAPAVLVARADSAGPAPGEVAGVAATGRAAVDWVCAGCDRAQAAPVPISAKVASPAKPRILFEMLTTLPSLSLAFI